MITFLRVKLMLAMLGCFSCSEQATNPEGSPLNQLYQVGGCGGVGLWKTSSGDTCFSYQFDSRLSVDFCVSANCCPDTNRFSLAYTMEEDKINIAVQDTAARLCRCVCPYVIHAEFHDLPLDYFLIVCRYDGQVWYEEDVWRQND
ncbi:MAG TPA: hypothetical protein VGA99_01940 [bacterium]